MIFFRKLYTLSCNLTIVIIYSICMISLMTFLQIEYIKLGKSQKLFIVHLQYTE